jgi:hypothetical protein
MKTYISLGRHQLGNALFRFFVMDTLLQAKSILLHPDYLENKTCDIAIIKLEKPLRGITRLRLNTATDELHDTVTGVGFGASGPASQPELVNAYSIKLAGQNIIDSVGGALLNGQSTMLYADFDSPDARKGCNPLGSATPVELEYGIGGGDSGGPLFVSKNGELCLAGIATYAPKVVDDLLKNGYYCGIIGWTRISAFSDWIRKNR